MLTPQPHPLVVLDGHEQIRHGFAQDVGAFEIPDCIPELHVLGTHVCIDGRTFVACSCGLVLEDYARWTSCPIGDAEDDYRAAVRLATQERDRVTEAWQQRGEIANRDMLHAIATERR